MGTSVNVAQFAGKLQAGGVALKGATTASVAQAALAGKMIFLANMGTTRLRNVGKGGARVGARFDIKGGANPTALLRYTGPAHLINNPTGAHIIEPRGRTRTAGGRKRKGAQSLTIGSGHAAYAHHPGTSGKQFYQRSVPQVAAAAVIAMRRSTSTALRKVF